MSLEKVFPNISTEIPKKRAEAVALFHKLTQEWKVIEIDKKAWKELFKKRNETDLAYQDLLDETALFDYLKHFRSIIFWSARIKEWSEDFKFVFDLAKRLASTIETDIITWNWPWMMRAGIQWLESAKKDWIAIWNPKNIWLWIRTPFEEKDEDFVDKVKNHKHFTPRIQDFFTMWNSAYIAPGWIWTLDELVNWLQLAQFWDLEEEFKFIASDFWKPMIDAFNDVAYHKRTEAWEIPLVSEKDLNLITFSDDIEKITEIIKTSYDFWREIKNNTKHIK